MKIKIYSFLIASFAFILCLKFLIPSAKASSPQFTIVSLGVLQGTTISQAFGINDSNQIVGRSSNTEGVDDRAFIWQIGQMTELPNLGNNPTVGYGINNKSQIVGGSETASGTPSAVIWQNGQIQPIASPSAINSLALGINNNGEVVGWSVVPQQGSNMQYDFDWQNGSITDITPKDSPYSGAPLAVNDTGEIVGWAAYPDDTGLFPTYPLLWIDKYSLPTRFNMLSSTRMTSLAHGINNKGQFVGDYDPTNTGHSHAFLWNNGQVTDLGTLGGADSYAQAINDNGQIVGGSLLADNSTEHAFIWQDGQMYDLGTLGGIDSYANAINNEGEIVGYSYTSSGSAQAVLWTPIAPTSTPTPTPTPSPTAAPTFTPTPTIVPTFTPTPTKVLTPTPTPKMTTTPIPTRTPPPICTWKFQVIKIFGFKVTIPVCSRR